MAAIMIDKNHAAYKPCMQFMGNCRLYNNWLAEKFKEQNLYNLCDSDGKIERKFKTFLSQERKEFQKHHRGWKTISNERFEDIEEEFKNRVINTFYKKDYPYFQLDPCLLRKKDEQCEINLELPTVKALGLYTAVKQVHEANDSDFEKNCLYRSPEGYLDFSIDD